MDVYFAVRCAEVGANDDPCYRLMILVYFRRSCIDILKTRLPYDQVYLDYFANSIMQI